MLVEVEKKDNGRIYVSVYSGGEELRFFSPERVIVEWIGDRTSMLTKDSDFDTIYFEAIMVKEYNNIIRIKVL